MSSELFSWLVKIGGFAGVCLGFAFMFIRMLYSDLKELQQKHNSDKDAMIEKLLKLNDKWNETINAQIEVQVAQKNLLDDLKDEIVKQRASKSA